jgi:hypothetical protein
MLAFIRAYNCYIQILLFTIWGMHSFLIQRHVCVYHLCHPDYLYATTQCILKNFVHDFCSIGFWL